MSLIGYARVSTSIQEAALQVDALMASGCERVFVDRASGASTARPELDKVLSYLRAGDVLVVWKLDRLGRSMRHLVELVSRLGKAEVGFRSLTEAIDASSPAGSLLFHILGALAQFERDLIKERTRAGLESARARGRLGGRPCVLTAQLVSDAIKLTGQGLTVQEAAHRLKVGRSSLYKALKAQSSKSSSVSSSPSYVLIPSSSSPPSTLPSNKSRKPGLLYRWSDARYSTHFMQYSYPAGT